MGEGRGQGDGECELAWVEGEEVCDGAGGEDQAEGWEGWGGCGHGDLCMCERVWGRCGEGRGRGLWITYFVARRGLLLNGLRGLFIVYGMLGGCF